MKNTSNKSLQKIYVIGFPKSGNTWLTRLLADLLVSPAGNGMLGEDESEIASDFNERIAEESHGQVSEFKILKSHFLPREMEYVDKNISRVVYIKRDFRDVIVSSFFHIHMGIEEDNVRLVSFNKAIKKGLIKTILYFYNRIKFWIHLIKICKKWGSKVGNWQDHIEEWEKNGKQNNKQLFVSVKYEDLLLDTRQALIRILQKLELPESAYERLDIAIERQSFKNKKKYFQNFGENCALPRGKNFNYKFLRKGVSGDWRNFFSKKMEDYLLRRYQKAFIENGYLNTNEKTD